LISYSGVVLVIANQVSPSGINVIQLFSSSLRGGGEKKKLECVFL